MSRGAKTIVVSDHIRKYTQKNYASKNSDDLIVIHGGASRDDFPYGYKATQGWRATVEEEFPELKSRRWLLLPGRVTRWKGHKDFIRLMGSLASSA